MRVMSKKIKRSAGLAALAFVALFLGPATSKASAWDGGPRVSFNGRFGLPHGSVSVYANNGRSFRSPYSRGYSRPYYRPYSYGYGRSSYRPFYRPYRVVRVRVLTPFPHWIFRRVYFSDPFGSYCAPY
jgi:hypothetical protein